MNHEFDQVTLPTKSLSICSLIHFKLHFELQNFLKETLQRFVRRGRRFTQVAITRRGRI